MQKLEKLIKDNHMEIKYKFEQIEKVLYKQAHKIRKYFPNKYEVDELVNEVWLRGKIQKLDDVRFVAKRAYFDMIDYVRSIEGRHVMRGGEYKKRARGFTNYHDALTRSNPSNENDFFDSSPIQGRTDIEAMIDKEQAEYILSCLPEQEAEVLRVYYFGEKNLKETGEILGLSECRTSSVRRSALQLTAIAARLFKEYPDILRDQENNNSFDANLFSHRPVYETKLEEVLPEYVADFEIDNECATSEEFVLEKDWETN
jgi:RNA polymerase sigma factor (sigma-70 family)